MAPLGRSFHLLIEDQGLVLPATLVPFDSNWFMLCLGYAILSKVVPCPLLSRYKGWRNRSGRAVNQETWDQPPGQALLSLKKHLLKALREGLRVQKS